uniref:Fibronectin type-III domain-containing protein n=1 Tax=Sphaeramia orbicularis TaxID=375764 RepID=A0A673A3E5_9TELE
MQRSIREVNTSSHWCMLWDLDEDTHYSVQVRHTHTHTHTHIYIHTLCCQGQAATVTHGRLFTVVWTVMLCLSSDEPAMEGLGMTPHLQTGELLIITTVLLLWAGQTVIALFCRQYDIIKDNDSNGAKEKAKSSPIYHNGAVRSKLLPWRLNIKQQRRLSGLTTEVCSKYK